MLSLYLFMRKPPSHYRGVLTRADYVRETVSMLRLDSSSEWDSYECLKWPFPVKPDRGFGVVTIADKFVPAYRLAYELIHGKADMKLVRLCEEISCFHPLHWKAEPDRLTWLKQAIIGMEDLDRDNWQQYPCVEWSGAHAQRYGIILQKGGRVKFRVTRLVYELVYGKKAGPLMVMHRCDNPPCFLAPHLQLGTQSENMVDMFSKGRARRAKGEFSSRASINNLQAEKIVMMTVSGFTPREIVRYTNIDYSTVYNIAVKRCWNHLWEGL